MVADDEIMIALDVEATLMEAGAKVVGPGLALDHIDFDPFVVDPEDVAGPLHLQAIARDGVAIDRHGSVIE